MLPAERENSKTMIVEVLPSRYGASVHHLRQADGIELTIGQGAKPGTGGLLLGSKVSEEIAGIRDLPTGVDQRSWNCLAQIISSIDRLDKLFLFDYCYYYILLLFHLSY